jgi:hypothetical protein
MTRRVAVVSLLLGTHLSACDTNARSGDAPSASEWIVVEDLRLDGNRFDFVAIGDVAVAGDGSMAVLQTQTASVLLFDSTGTPRGAVGRGGTGPGEFRAPISVGWLADTLWVLDVAQRRFSLFDREHAFLRSVEWAREFEVVGREGEEATSYRVRSPTSLLSGGGMIADVAPTGDPAQPARGEAIKARIPLDGGHGTILLQFPYGGSRVTPSGGPGISMIAVIPYSNPTVSDVSADGERLVLARADLEASTYDVTVVSARGDTLCCIGATRSSRCPSRPPSLTA